LNDVLNTPLPGCLIVTAAADDFAAEITRGSTLPIPLTACATAEDALARYSDEKIVFGNPDLVADILPDLPMVDWVQSSWAGITPLSAIGYRDYVLTGVKEVFGPQMSEYVLGYLLAHELRIIERIEHQDSRGWFKAHSGVIEGKRLGIMGTGSIGRHIANTARSFGVQVFGFSLSGRSVAPFEKVFSTGQLHSFLRGCDYLVAALPQTEKTDNLLDERALAKLPEHAYFCNIGRSNVVDDDALIHALKNNKLAGAVLDVFDVEPIPGDSPLWNTKNLLVTAHIAAISHPSLIVPIFLENYERYVSKRPLKYVIDLDREY